MAQKKILRSVGIAALLGTVATVASIAQNVALLTEAGPSDSGQAVAGSDEVLRVYQDPVSRQRWLLIRDSSHPSWPRRLVPAPENFVDSKAAGKDGSRTDRPMVIRAGDKVIVEEHTAQSELLLEAVAMGSGAAGDLVEVRLRVDLGKRRLRVRVLAPGRAVLQGAVEGKS